MVLAPLPEVEVGYSHTYVLGILIRGKWHFGYHTLLYLTVFHDTFRQLMNLSGYTATQTQLLGTYRSA